MSLSLRANCRGSVQRDSGCRSNPHVLRVVGAPDEAEGDEVDPGAQGREKSAIYQALEMAAAGVESQYPRRIEEIDGQADDTDRDADVVAKPRDRHERSRQRCGEA